MCICLLCILCVLCFASVHVLCISWYAALWRRRPERPNRGRVSFTQTLLDKPCANGTVAGYVQTSVTAHFHNSHRPSLRLCPGSLRMRRSGFSSVASQSGGTVAGFRATQPSSSLPPSLYLGQRLLDCFNSFACPTKNICLLLFSK